MAIIKATMFMSLSRFAWTESHWINTFTDLPSAAGEANKMANKRAQLFGDQTSMDLVRLSQEGVFRDSQIIQKDLLAQANGVLTINATTPTPSDIEDVALIMRAESGVLHRKTIYLRGNPDVAASGKFLPRGIDPSQAGFLRALNNYQNFLITDGWGFYGRDIAQAKVQVGAVVADGAPPAHYGVQVVAGAGGYAFGDQVQLSGFQVRAGAAAVNGIYQIAGPVPAAVGGLQNYFLVNSLGIDPGSVLRYGTIQKVVKTFLPYTNFVPRYVKRRATGGRTGLPLGRRSLRK